MAVDFTRRRRGPAMLAALLVPGCVLAQVKASPASDEIPIERCDLLPVVRVKAAGAVRRRHSGRGFAGPPIGVTIDLQRKVASLKLAPSDSQGMFAEMEEAMHDCDIAFNEVRASQWEDCFDPETALDMGWPCVIGLTPCGGY